jgi:hypothetical protein
MIQALGYMLLAVGGAICAINFYLSFFRYLVHVLRHEGGQYRWTSGFPLVGSGLVVLSLVVAQLPGWAFLTGAALATLDTGGIHWLAGVIAWQALKSWSSQEKGV